MSDTFGILDSGVIVSYKWIIEESFLTGKKTGEMLKSPVIRINDSKHCQIWLYPRGLNEKYKDYVSIFLYSLKGRFKVRIRFYVLDNKNEIVSPRITKHKHLLGESKPRWGFFEFMKYERLSEENIMIPSSGSVGNTLTIICELINYVDDEESIFESEYPTRLKEFDDFEKLIDNDEFSDVVLEMENKKLYAHKSILANKSQVFTAMFTHSMKEKEQDLVEIEDVSYDVMKELLRYIYSGKVNDLGKIAKDLFVAADKYLIENLKKVCENYLVHHTNAENVFEYLNFASVHNALALRQHCLEFIKFNVKKVGEKTNFKLSGLDKDTIDEVFQVIAASARD
ncbi:hypothetical protein QAD02_011448 [Eretmocerus hayati]|uniref:Uncharacterized protein n=1 Tax=Eretmocerus hayati TaxID=131215 RepID=A0ACC2NX19_9HYME|nr:hypothetical protein QAD02_011448 [Eretmocerus hayati]